MTVPMVPALRSAASRVRPNWYRSRSTWSTAPLERMSSAPARCSSMKPKKLALTSREASQ